MIRNRIAHFGLLVGGLSFALDRGVKIVLIALMRARDGVPLDVLPFFNIVMVWNRGVSFGMLSDAGPYVRWGVIAGGLIILALLLVWLANVQYRFVALAIGLIIGGALGNLVDRFVYNGHVADFFDIYIGNFHWPAFNIADMSICIGVAFLLWDSLFGKHRARRQSRVT